MKNIKNFNDYITEELLFSHGGNIGGEHKKPVSDEEIESGKAFKKGYTKQPKGVTNDARKIENEKRSERKINLMGSELNGYYDKDNVQRLIDSVEYYLKDKQDYLLRELKAKLEILPDGVAEHFGIDLDSENVVEDFIENKFELFKRSYEMFKEIKDYSTRYGGY